MLMKTYSTSCDMTLSIFNQIELIQEHAVIILVNKLGKGFKFVLSGRYTIQMISIFVAIINEENILFFKDQILSNGIKKFKLKNII